MHELVRTNNAVLITAIEALLKGADIPHMVLDQHMSVLEGSLGMLPRRIVVDEEDWDVARQLLEDAGLAHELRPASSGPKSETTDDAVLGGRLRLTPEESAATASATTPSCLRRRPTRGPATAWSISARASARRVWRSRCAVRSVDVTLVEIDPELSDIAAENVARNGLERAGSRRHAGRHRAGRRISPPAASGRARRIMC